MKAVSKLLSLIPKGQYFNNDKILLVKENNGKWSLPGGCVDINQTIKSNTEKEVKEESGLNVKANRIIAVQDRDKHNFPMYAYNVCKISIICEVLGGSFENNIKTVEGCYFGMNELPELSEEKNNREQIDMCFSAYKILIGLCSLIKINSNKFLLL